MRRSSRALAQLYGDHNAKRGHGFLFGGHQRIAVMRNQLKGGCGSVLDLGCRDGSLFAAMALETSFAVGIDIDEEALRNFPSSNLLAPCKADLWGALPFRSHAFDAVLAGEVLEHLPFPQTTVAEVARVLRPGGRFVGSVPNSYRLKNRLRFLLGRPYEHDPTHLRQFSIKLLEELLARHFRSIRIFPCVGRFVTVAPRLTANDLVWSAESRKPLREGSAGE